VWYQARVISFDEALHEHTLEYTDDQVVEILDLREEQWRPAATPAALEYSGSRSNKRARNKRKEDDDDGDYEFEEDEDDDDEEEEEDGDDEDDDYEEEDEEVEAGPARKRRRKAVPAAAASRAVRPAPATTVVTEAEGYQLFVSTQSPTGYKGVVALASGRFNATWQRQGSRERAYLGSFDTAVEAAVAYAKCEETHEPPARRRCPDAVRPAPAPAVATEAEGYQLFRSERSFTHRHMTEFTGLDLEMCFKVRKQARRASASGEAETHKTQNTRTQHAPHRHHQCPHH